MKNLKLLREQNNLTQQQMADIFRIQRPTYSRYENGERQPDFELLINIAKYFNVTIDYLLGNEKKPSDNSDDLSNKIIEMFKRLDDTKQKQALEYLEFLVARDNQEK